MATFDAFDRPNTRFCGKSFVLYPEFLRDFDDYALEE